MDVRQKNPAIFCNRRLGFYLLALGVSLLSACSRPAFMVGMGTSGKYLEAREEITRRGGNVDKAIQNLEAVVRDDPTCCRPYHDSLTLLGRAYYMRSRYGMPSPFCREP